MEEGPMSITVNGQQIEGWMHRCVKRGTSVWFPTGTDCSFCDESEPRPTFPLGSRGGRSSTGDRLTANFTRVKL